MKTSKVLGAVALTAALAMGTVPAFAAGVDTNTNEFSVSVANNQDGTGKNYTGTGSTKVEATTYVVQMNVTVPIQMSVALPATDGKIVFPDPAAYKITNNGSENITVSNVALNTISDEFALTKGTIDSTTGAISGVEDSDTKYEYYMKVGKYNTTTQSLDGAVTLRGTAPQGSGGSTIPGALLQSKDENLNATVWTVASKNALGVGWDGQIAYPKGVLGTTNFNNQVIELANITWTISANDVANNPAA